MQHKKLLFAIFSMILSGLCFYFSTNFYDIWPLAWIAPIPVLCVALENKWWQAGIIAFFAACIGTSNFCLYIPFGLPLSIIFSSILLSGIIFSIEIIIFRHLVKRTTPSLAVWIFPSIVVIGEYLQSFSIFTGTLGSLAYSQMTFPSVLQIASLTGLWGISFTLSLFSSIFAITFYYRKNTRPILSIIISIITILLVLFFGFSRINHFNFHKNDTANVALITVPETFKILTNADHHNVSTILDQYANQINQLPLNINIVVLPEKFIIVTDQDSQQIKERLSKIAKQKNILLVTGINYFYHGQHYNQDWVFDSQGQLINAYEKHHMLPAFESDIVVGNQLFLIPYHNHLLGIEICKDLYFREPARSYGKAGVGLMIVSALDFKVDAWLHDKPAIMRGIENNYSIARTAQWGLLSISSPTGGIVIKPSSDKTPAVLISTVTFGKGNSFYSKHGDWLAYVCMLFFVVCFIGSVLFEAPVENDRDFSL
jgi:apolipoprotein N-acyltransferase